MRDSDTYLHILDEGGIAELRKMTLRIGQKLWGPPAESDRATLSSIENIDRLEYLLERIVEVKSWQELLDVP